MLRRTRIPLRATGALSGLLLATAMAAGGTEPIAGRILERLESDRDQILRHRYVESTLLEKLGQDGTVRSSTVEVYEVFTRDGRRLKRPLSEDLSQDSQGFSIVREEESGFMRPRRDTVEAADPPAGDGLDLEKLVGCFNLHPIGRETLEGKDALRVAFASVDGCMGRETRATRLLGNLAGTLWVDAGDFDILRVRGFLKSPVTLGFGILGRVDRFDLEVDREPIDPGFYATTRITYRARGSSFLLNRFDLRSSRHRSAFADVAPAEGPSPSALLAPPAPDGSAAPR
jgi:hypothetical protein